MKKIILLSLNLFCLYFIQAQTQTLRGRVIDHETRQVLEGAKITITTPGKDSGLFAMSNASGDYTIADVSVGRHNLLITLDKYNDIVLQNIILSSAKEMVLNIDMSEAVSTYKSFAVKSKKKGFNKQRQCLGECAFVYRR